MTFSEFAKELHIFYAGEMSVPEFTGKLLLHITDYNDAVLKHKAKNRSEKTFSSYYYGHKPITPIAKLIAVDGHIKRNKFLTFLKSKEFNNSNKGALCKAFSEYFPDKELNSDNIFDAIADEYERIIHSSVSKTDTQQSTPSLGINDIKEENITETIKAIEPNAVDSFMTELKEAIRNLQDTGHQIASRVSNMKSDKDFKLPEWALPSELNSVIQKELSKEMPLYSKLESEYNKLQKLYYSIDRYNIEHKEEILTEALKLISQINKDDFIEKWRKATIKSTNNQYIIELNSLIQNYFESNSK